MAAFSIGKDEYSQHNFQLYIITSFPACVCFKFVFAESFIRACGNELQLELPAPLHGCLQRHAIAGRAALPAAQVHLSQNSDVNEVSYEVKCLITSFHEVVSMKWRRPWQPRRWCR